LDLLFCCKIWTLFTLWATSLINNKKHTLELFCNRSTLQNNLECTFFCYHSFLSLFANITQCIKKNGSTILHVNDANHILRKSLFSLMTAWQVLWTLSLSYSIHVEHLLKTDHLETYHIYTFLTSGPSIAAGSVIVDITSLISSIGISPITLGLFESSRE